MRRVYKITVYSDNDKWSYIVDSAAQLVECLGLEFEDCMFRPLVYVNTLDMAEEDFINMPDFKGP